MNDPRVNPSIFARGAVDLSTLRAPSTSAVQRGGSGVDGGQEADAAVPAASSQRSGAQPTAAGGVAVVDVTEATFQSEVLERSLSTPVVVDFWASWCGPCKQLSPVLEKLAVEGNGVWVLAKVDVDANPRLAQMFRVQSIPMVFAVVGGQPVELFTGVLPEAQLRQGIDSLLQAAGVAVATAEDPRLNAADEAMMSGDLDAAERAYRKKLSESPADAVAVAGLAQVSLMRRVGGVDAATVLAAARAKPDDVPAQTLAADVEMVSGRADAAYARLITLVRRVSAEEREAVRQHLVSLFTVAGPDDPEVAAARRALANALF